MSSSIAQKKYYVASLGVYYSRLVTGIFDKMPDEVYIIMYKQPVGDKKSHYADGRNVEDWVKEQKAHLESDVKRPLMGWASRNRLKVEEWETFEDPDYCFSQLWRLLRKIEEESSKEAKIPEIWIDITSSTKIFAVVASVVASYFDNTYICYTHYQNAKHPEMYSKEMRDDPGMPPVNMSPAYIGRKTLSREPVRTILCTLDELGGKVTRLKDILTPLAGKRKEFKVGDKGSAIRLARYLRRLEKFGVLSMHSYAGGRVDVFFTKLGARIAKEIRDEISTETSLKPSLRGKHPTDKTKSE
jgi:hypothetical protein